MLYTFDHRSIRGPLCLFPNCGIVFPNALALDHHQRSHDFQRFSPPTRVNVTLDGSHRSGYVNNEQPGALSSELGRYLPFNENAMTISSQGVFNQHAARQVGSMAAYQAQEVTSTNHGNYWNGHDTYAQQPTAMQPLTTNNSLGFSNVQDPSGGQTHSMPSIHRHNATAHIVPSARVRCPHPGCATTVSRPSDLNRHMRTHQGGLRGFDCPAPGCGRKGGEGFVRKDKMMDHYRAVHG